MLILITIISALNNILVNNNVQYAVNRVFMAQLCFKKHVTDNDAKG